MTSRGLVWGTLLVALCCADDAAAQGRGRPKAPRAPKAPVTTAPAAAGTTSSPATSPTSVTTPASAGLAPAAPPAASFRQFGSWLDDASGAAAGEGRTGIGVGYWRVSGGSQLNVPMVDVGYAFTDRLQAGVSVPFYHASYAGTTARGLDDIYLSGKMTVIDPSLTVSEVGLAVSPVLEVLSTGGSGGRLHYALPVSLELRRQPFRMFGSAGYFSRGSVFTAGAVEWSSAAGYMLTGAVTHAYSTSEDAALDGLGVSRRRADVTGSVACPLGRWAAAYVSVGRTLTRMDEGGTALSLTGGVSFRFTRAQATP